MWNVLEQPTGVSWSGFYDFNGQLLCNAVVKSFKRRPVDARSVGCEEIRRMLMGGVVRQLQCWFWWGIPIA